MLRYAITDRTLFPGDEFQRQAALIQQAARLAAQGIDFLQLREKDLPTGALANLARRIQAVVCPEAHSTYNSQLTTHNCPKLLINSRADVAIAVGADGVHLTSAPGELTPAQARRLYAAAGLPDPIISLSCHTLAEVARAANSPKEDRPTHILFGPVFGKSVANQPGVGVETLRQACALAAPIPVLALGGITEANAPACLAAGAAGIAAIRLFQPPELTQYSNA